MKGSKLMLQIRAALPSSMITLKAGIELLRNGSPNSGSSCRGDVKSVFKLNLPWR
jgi:hypothetical protein